MISCIEWIPKGAADPKPKRYELSPAELEMLKKQAEMEGALEEGKDHDYDNDSEEDEEKEEEEERVSSIQTEAEEAGAEKRTTTKKKNKKSKSEGGNEKLKRNDVGTLPSDLRMEEYSSSDDDDDGDDDNDYNGTAPKVGNLLITGTDNEMIGTRPDERGLPVEDIDEEHEKEGNDDELEKEERGMDNDDGDSMDADDDEDKDSDDDDDDDDDDLADVADTREYMPVDVEGLESMNLGQTGSLYYGEEEEDDADDEDSDIEDTNLQPDDALIVVAKTEEDFASLEVHVYEQKTGNLFVHHDIPLPSYPLCLAHGDINHEGGAGNYCAVGTFHTGIEVWNLDILDALEPTCILGGEDTSVADELMRSNMAQAVAGKQLKRNKKKKKKGGGLRPGSHTDAVMSLSWNKNHRQVIASGSADCTVKIWDITEAGGGRSDASSSPVAATFKHHRDKVASVVWHPIEGTILATGSFDKTVALVDARTNDGKNVKKAKIPADCEAIAWDPFRPQCLTAASEDGTLICWDVRKFGGDPLWSFVAREYGGVSDLSYNTHVPGMLATCAIDKTVTLWDTQNSNAPNNASKVLPPIPCGNKEMGVGKLYTVSFYPSSPWLLGCGGGGNQLALWDLSDENAVQSRFGSRVSGNAEMPAGADGIDKEKAMEGKEKDFEAMMVAGDAAAEKIKNEVKYKKKKGKGKKKVHRKGR